MSFIAEDHLPLRVAVLGFSALRFHRCRVAAYYLGQHLAETGYEAIGGNITGVFADVFRGVQSSSGHSRALLEKQYGSVNCQLECERLRFVSNRINKHRQLAQMADMAVVIGGGTATKHVIFELLKLEKPVWALYASGGIVSAELDSEVVVLESMENICVSLDDYAERMQQPLGMRDNNMAMGA